jgi:hypothetical protein
MSIANARSVDAEEVRRREEERRKRPDVQHYKPGAFSSSRRPDPEDWRAPDPEPLDRRAEPEELIPKAATAPRGELFRYWHGRKMLDFFTVGTVFVVNRNFS